MGYAHIDSGTVNVTAGSRPDGTIRTFYMGSNAGNTTMNISGDFTVRGHTYWGYQSTATDVSTINQTAGAVVLGDSAGDRTYMGRGFGQSAYNLSGGTLATMGDWDQFGNNQDDADDGASTFIFNQTGGIYTDTGANELVMADKAPASTVVNVSGGTFQANAAGGARLGNNGTATLNIDGTGAFETSGTAFNIARYAPSHGSVNLSNGTFTVTGTYLNVGNAGTGVFNQTGGASDVTRLILAEAAGSSGTYSISGGSLKINNYIAGHNGDGVFEVLGSGATSIETDTAYFWEDTLRVKLDAGGSTLVKAVGGIYNDGIDLRKCTFEVDTLAGFDGGGGDTYDIMWTAEGFKTTDASNNDMVFSNLSGTEFSWGIVAKDGGEVLQLVIPGTPESLYGDWLAVYPGVGSSTNLADNPDGDVLNNLAEYALGGVPDDPQFLGHIPKSSMQTAGGTNYIEYVYVKRKDSNDRGLAYSLEQNTDLLSGLWSNANAEVVGSGTLDTEFDSITNRIQISGEKQEFIRLRIESQ